MVTIFTTQLLRGRAPAIFGDGEQRRDFVHVSDVVAANLLCLDSELPRGVFNVGSGKGTSVNEIAELLCKRIAPEIRPVRAEAKPGELRFSIADISRLSKMTGYRPRGALEDRIGEVIASCKTAACA